MMKARPKKSATSSTATEEDALENLERRLELLGGIPTAPLEQTLSTAEPEAQPLLTTDTVAAPRDRSELEGTLLPVEDLPTATPWTGIIENEQDAALAATPVEAFAYPSNEELEKEDYMNGKEAEGTATVEAVAVHNTPFLPTAPPIPTYEDTNDKDRAEASVLAKAKQKAKIAAEMEREAIRKGNRKIFAQQYYENVDTEKAKKEALRRDRAGLQIKEDKWFGKETKTVPQPDPDQTAYFDKKKGPGYDVKEYDTKEYQFGGEYETKEYKSVYDD